VVLWKYLPALGRSIGDIASRLSFSSVGRSEEGCRGGKGEVSVGGLGGGVFVIDFQQTFIPEGDELVRGPSVSIPLTRCPHI